MRRVAPISIIVLAGLVTAVISWGIAQAFVPEDFTGIIAAFAAFIGLWAGMFVGVIIARKVYPNPGGRNDGA